MAVHRGTLCIDGTASTGFTFRHADGTPYGRPLRPAAVELARQVFEVLTGLGFKQTRARELVDAVQRCGAEPDTLDAFVHAALRAT